MQTADKSSCQTGIGGTAIGANLIMALVIIAWSGSISVPFSAFGYGSKLVPAKGLQVLVDVSMYQNSILDSMVQSQWDPILRFSVHHPC